MSCSPRWKNIPATPSQLTVQDLWFRLGGPGGKIKGGPCSDHQSPVSGCHQKLDLWWSTGSCLSLNWGMKGDHPPALVASVRTACPAGKLVRGGLPEATTPRLTARAFPNSPPALLSLPRTTHPPRHARRRVPCPHSKPPPPSPLRPHRGCAGSRSALPAEGPPGSAARQMWPGPHPRSRR